MSYRSKKAAGGIEYRSTGDLVAYMLTAYELAPDDAGPIAARHSAEINHGMAMGSHVAYVADKIAEAEELKIRTPKIGDFVELLDPEGDGPATTGTVKVLNADGGCTVECEDGDEDFETGALAWTGTKWIDIEEPDDED